MADTPDPQELARRYLDLWQQHLTQSATDPELASGLAKLMQALPVAGGAMWPAWPGTQDGDGTAPGTAATVTAPDGGNERFDDLIGRLDAIEKRLDALEREPRPSRKRAAKGTGKSRS